MTEAEEEVDEADEEEAEEEEGDVEEEELEGIDADLADAREGAVAVLTQLKRPTGPDMLLLRDAAKKLAEAFTTLDENLSQGGELPIEWED